MPDRPIALCYGTRPQVIKASVLRSSLGRIGRVWAIDTGQHYDHALNRLLYQQLGVEPPDLFLEVGSGSHAEQTAAILTRLERVLIQQRPEVVVVIGDTNSTLGSALAAAKLRIPVVHVEAGLRAADDLMAEEINRRAVDAIARLLCTPSAMATHRMRAEHPTSRVVETGDVAYDVLLGQVARLPLPAAVVSGGLPPGYIYATLHRAELTDQPELLVAALRALAALQRPVVLPVHPRTRAILASRGEAPPTGDGLMMIPAVGYLESLALCRGAAGVITDSGGVQREAYWMGIPCVTLRTESEWEETLACGANRLVAPREVSARLGQAIEAQIARWSGIAPWPRNAYGDGRAAEAVAVAIETMWQ